MFTALACLLVKDPFTLKSAFFVVWVVAAYIGALVNVRNAHPVVWFLIAVAYVTGSIFSLDYVKFPFGLVIVLEVFVALIATSPVCMHLFLRWLAYDHRVSQRARFLDDVARRRTYRRRS